jgi:hypothetical protein
MLDLKSGCACSLSSILTYECTVVGGISAGSTIWRGSALAECPTGEINLLHNHFLTDEMTCNGRDIVVTGLSIGIGGVYTSQLDVKVEPDLIGQTIDCVYDNLINETIIDSLTIQYISGEH